MNRHPFTLPTAFCATLLLLVLPSCSLIVGEPCERVLMLDDLGDAALLDVEAFNGSVDIGVTDGDSIVGTATVSAVGDCSAHDQKRADCLAIDSALIGDALSLRPIHPGCVFEGSLSYNLRVPPGTAVKIKTSNGAVRVDVPCPGLDISTSNGPIVARSAGGNAWLHSSNGPITLLGDPREFECATSNGPVVVRFDGSWSGNGVIKTANGPVDISCGGSLGAVVEASTSSGECSVLTGGQVVTGRTVSVGAGPGRLEIETSNSSVQVRSSD